MKIDPLALYGAALSTMVFLWTVWKARRKVVLQIIPTFAGPPNGIGYTVVISNHSPVPVYIVETSMHYFWRKVTLRRRISDAIRYRALRWRGWCGCRLPKGSEDPTPFVLAPGQSEHIYIPEAALAETIGKDLPSFGVYVRDGLMRRHYSRPEKPMPPIPASK